MLRISASEAKKIGLLSAKKKKESSHRFGLSTWDAKLLSDVEMWLQIPFVPPSLNIWKNWHWSRQRRYKKDLAEAIQGLVMAFRLPRYEKAIVRIVYFHSTIRRRDPVDNYAPKFLMDGLVEGGILIDDNGKLVKVPPVEMEYDKERPRTEVFIQKM